MLCIKKVFRNYSNFELSVQDLRLPSDQLVLFCGPSGSGKSSLFSCLIGFDQVADVEWSLGDLNMAQMGLKEKKMGVVFQEGNLFPHLTAQANIDFAVRRGGAGADNDSLATFIEKLELGPHLQKKAEQLSGGQKKRVALVQALMGDPRVVFLDEPLVGLEARLRKVVVSLLEDWVAKSGKPILLASHHQEAFAASSAPRVFMDNGKILNKSSVAPEKEP